MKIPVMLAWLILAGTRVWADLPEVIAFQQVNAPFHQIPSPGGGASNYVGEVLATKNYLVTSEPLTSDPTNSDTILSRGWVEVFDRLSLRKLGEIRPPANLAKQSRWGTALAVSGNYLAVGPSDVGTNPGVDIYDLTTLRRICHLHTPKGHPSESFGGKLTAVGSRLLVGAADAVHVYDFRSGKLLGTMALGFDGGRFGSDGYETSKGSRFLLNRDEPDYASAESQFFAVDLKKPSDVLAIRNLPFLKSGQAYLNLELQGRYLVLSEYSKNPPRHHGYDLVSRKRCYTVTDRASDWSGSASWQKRLFVPEPDSGRGRVVVRDHTTGKISAIITPPAGASGKRFGTTVACVNATLFISSSRAWFAYDPATLKFRYKIDDQGWDLAYSEVVPILGSKRVGFVFNYQNYSGQLYNSYHYNPQVMLLDPAARQFTHRLNLEDSTIVSGDSLPWKFGRSLYASGAGAVSVLRPGYEGDYKTFSLSPSAGNIERETVAAVSFDATPGFDLEVQRIGQGAAQTISSVPFGRGDLLDLDIPFSDYTAGVRYQLVRNQLSRVTDAYEDAWTDLETLLGAKADNVVARGDLVILAAPKFSSPLANSGAVFVLDKISRQIVRVIQPTGLRADDRFGSSMALDGDRLAVTSARATFIYDITTGTKLREFPAAMNVALSGDILIRAFNESPYANGQRSYVGQVSAHDLVTGMLLFTVPTGYVSNFPYWTTRIAVGASHLLLGLNVHDLGTGQYLHTLKSPNPEPEDNFPSAIAAEGNLCVVGASGQGAVYLFDLASGQHLRTCRIHDRPEGFANYATSGTGLCVDAATGMLALIVPDPTTAAMAGIHLFEIDSGKEIAKIQSPLQDVRNIHYLADAIALDGSNLVFLQDLGKSVGLIDVMSLRSVPLIQETVPLTSNLFYQISVVTRKDTVYRLLSGPSPGQLKATGSPFNGTGKVESRRIPLIGYQRNWYASFDLKWANQTSSSD